MLFSIYLTLDKIDKHAKLQHLFDIIYQYN